LFPSYSSTTSSTFAASLADTYSRTATTTRATTPTASASPSPPSPAPPPQRRRHLPPQRTSPPRTPALLTDVEADADASGGWCTSSIYCVKLYDADDEDEDDDGPLPLRADGGGDAFTTGDTDPSSEPLYPWRWPRGRWRHPTRLALDTHILPPSLVLHRTLPLSYFTSPANSVPLTYSTAPPLVSLSLLSACRRGGTSLHRLRLS
jgi:hypothetical protein